MQKTELNLPISIITTCKLFVYTAAITVILTTVYLYIFRITMEYGGSDVSRLFHSLLARCGVALTELSLTHPADVIQLQALKETCCHLNHVC